jgi:NADH-quinone oxidoreductase subunit N/multicomponent Na+:H+ antiporter subunit D
MLAYSSMGQMGLAMLAFGIGTEEGVFAALFLLFNHAIIKSLLFMSGSYLVYNSKNKFIGEMNGVGKFMPVTAFLFALGAFAIIGLPPFAGFWSKLYTLMAAANQQMVLIISLVLLVSLIEVVYYLRVVNRIFFEKREDNDIYEEIPYKKPSINAMISMLILGFVIILIGFYPDLIINVLHKASADLLDTSGYIHNVLSSVVSH